VRDGSAQGKLRSVYNMDFNTWKEYLGVHFVCLNNSEVVALKQTTSLASHLHIC
jgi:hypothetical protein